MVMYMLTFALEQATMVQRGSKSKLYSSCNLGLDGAGG